MKSTYKPAEKALEKQANKPVENSIEKPIEKLVEKPKPAKTVIVEDKPKVMDSLPSLTPPQSFPDQDSGISGGLPSLGQPRGFGGGLGSVGYR